MTKPRLTPDEHDELGRVLAGIRDELTHRTTQLGNAYPTTGQDSVPFLKLQSAIKAIDEARSALEDALYREHPLSADTSVYWPQPEDRSRIGRR